MNLPTMPISAAMVPDESDPSLVGAWLNERVKLGEDFSSEGNDGTPTDVILDRLGAKFNGSSSFITMGDTASLSSLAAFTVSGWAKMNTVKIARLAAKWSAGTQEWVIAFTAAGELTVGAFTKTGVTTTLGLVAGQWYNITVVWAGGTSILVYVNGNLGETVAIDQPTPADTAANTVIGKHSATATEYFDGNIAAVDVYDEAKALTWTSARYEMAVPA